MVLYTLFLQCDPNWPRSFSLSDFIHQIECCIPFISKHPEQVNFSRQKDNCDVIDYILQGYRMTNTHVI